MGLLMVFMGDIGAFEGLFLFFLGGYALDPRVLRAAG